MDPHLLSTKLRIPPLPHQPIRRDRLVDSIEVAFPSYKLVLVSAPAGYGKTTLLAQWAGTSRHRVAWLSIGEEDDDAERFLRHLLSAWGTVEPAVWESPPGLLLGAMAPDRDAVLAAIVAVANAGPPDEQTVFVLDDYHLIADPAIHQALTFLLDHLPPTLHFALAGRAEPPLPLARYRARQELLELRTEELTFSVDETAEFVGRQAELALTDDDVADLHAQLEGWVAGLQLASLTLDRRRGRDRPLVVGGRNRFIADYLSQDVLANQPEEIRRFLLRTSILDRLCGPLCDAVTQAKGSREILERVERENLFLVPLDDQREWYRYHRLFADFLLAELDRRHPEEVADLHRRAAGWHLAHDLPHQAVQHAIAGNDPELVVRVFERYVNIKLNCGELNDVARWLDALPAEWFAAYPVLDLSRAGLLALTGAFDACLRSLDDVEKRLAATAGEEMHWQQAMVAAVRCFIACIQNDLDGAEGLARQALPDLRDESASFRASIHHALGDTYRRHGRWEDAKACYLRVPTFIQAPEYRVQEAVQSVHVYGALADLELEQGRLRAAGEYWRKAQAAVQQRESWGRVELPVVGWIFIRFGELLYEWNDLALARDHLERGLERAELGGDVRTLIAGYVNAARLSLTEGDLEAATQALERARPLIEQAPFPEWTGRYERCRLELWLAQDRLRTAVDWADARLGDDALQDLPERVVAHLALARLLIVKGDAAARERALALLNRLRDASVAQGRAGLQIEALALLAIAHRGGGDRVEALTALDRALRLAEPEGYLRLFADLGPPMARLLQEARAREVMPNYVGRLLAACGSNLASASAGDRALPDPLSAREQEVLRLIAAGLTNREIAERLFISPETVKKHTAGIYGKLGVGNRTEAATRASQLGVLG
jgi:LuxR family maltose regulon positive regulatory protein